jgi:hypothetical protein
MQTRKSKKKVASAKEVEETFCKTIDDLNRTLNISNIKLDAALNKSYDLLKNC